MFCLILNHCGATTSCTPVASLPTPKETTKKTFPPGVEAADLWLYSWGAIDESAQHCVEFNTTLACVMLEREPTLVEAIQHSDSRRWVPHAGRLG